MFVKEVALGQKSGQMSQVGCKKEESREEGSVLYATKKFSTQHNTKGLLFAALSPPWSLTGWTRKS